MANFYGQIDLTKLSDIVKKHPSLVKKVTFKDGREHKLLNISVVDSLYDNHGFDKAIRINHNKNEHVASLNYYVGDLKKPEINKISPQKHENTDLLLRIQQIILVKPNP